MIEKLLFLKEKYNIEFFRFVDESFAIMNHEDFELFSIKYKEKINLPFWVQTTATSLTEKKVIWLKQMNCAAVTIGAEHGNEEFRQNVLNKKVSNKQIYDAMALLKKYKIRSSAYFMMGLPFETRELVFESIKMYRKLISEYDVSPSSAQCFFPFEGTELLKVCQENNFLGKNIDSTYAISRPALDMPDLSSEDILGLKRTFYAYAVMDKSLYPIIKICETPTETSNKILEEISKIYRK